MARAGEQEGGAKSAGDPGVIGPRSAALGVVSRVLVFAHPEKAGVRQLLPELLAFLRERVSEVRLEDDVRAFAQDVEEGRQNLESPPDLVLVLGGDGAILGAVRAFARHPVPTLGINFGRVGFLASTPAGRWHEVLEGALRGAAVIEPRQRLRCERHGPRALVRGVALNDVVVHRGAAGPMGTIRLSVGGLWVTDYRADGLIVATPSGSTAYSLSAGGPILVPFVPAFVITPICSQGLANRPLVVPATSELEVEVLEEEDPARVVIDGHRLGELAPGEVLRIDRHPAPYPLISMPDLDPFRRLRDRLGWSGSPRPAAGS